MDKTYPVTIDELQLLMHHIGELYEVGTTLLYDYKEDHFGEYRKEVFADGCEHRLDKHHQEAYRLLNKLCPDKKIDGEIDVWD